MKKTALIFLTLLTGQLWAQVDFKTIVPPQPVITGESFQVQYTIEHADRVSSFRPPVFNNFRFVSGPNLYTGSIGGNQPVKNYVFTLEGGKPGQYIIPGAVTSINGKIYKSDDALIEVISKAEAEKLYRSAGTSEYLLRPGEDPYQKISQNLFLKVMVNKQSCYPGEPVLAIFKLYSRLQSRSDIVKNPGFYGFTVYDMVNLEDKKVATEKVKGKTFDVHTIRMVQLFPLQPGLFTIDAMEVKNKVEFSRSVVNKKTEQEIIEGVLNNPEDAPSNANAEIFETTLSTEPVLIKVKPIPVTNKPADFNGATGIFTISSAVSKTQFAKNEEGVYEIIISGQGNFTQLSTPSIEWPEGIEGFEPRINDSFDKTKYPLGGSRTFRYHFISSHPGKYKLPAASFSFFDPGTNSYKLLSSPAVEMEITNQEKADPVTSAKKNSITEKNTKASKIAIIIILSLLAIVFIYWIVYRKPAAEEADKRITLPSVEDLLVPAKASLGGGEKEFYTSLHICAWSFFVHYLHISGSSMNKQELITGMKTKGINDPDITAVTSILELCETGIFTNVELQESKEAVLQRLKEILQRIRDQLL